MLRSAAAVRQQAVILGCLIVVITIVRVTHARCGVFAGNCVDAVPVTAPGTVVLEAAADAIHL